MIFNVNIYKFENNNYNRILFLILNSKKVINYICELCNFQR